MRIFGDRASQRLIAANGDQIVAAFPIPAGGFLNGINMDFHVIGGETPLLNMSMFGVTGYILPILDPDNEINIDSIWDLQVPKSDDMLFTAASDSLDTDLATSAVTTPDVDPGELSENWIDVSRNPKKIVSRREWVSFASSPTGFEGGAENIFRPTARFRIKTSRRYRVEVASYAMIALSSPALTETTTTVELSMSEQEWVMLQYMSFTLEQAWTQMIGLTETGAETPWADALQLVERILQPDLLEQTGTSFSAQSWQTYCISTFDISVPGRFEPIVLSGR